MPILQKHKTGMGRLRKNKKTPRGQPKEQRLDADITGI